MASGSVYGSWGGYTLRSDWSSSISIEGNYSDITINHYLTSGSGWSLSIGSRSNSCTCGEAKSFNSPEIRSGGNINVQLGTTYHRVYHNDDGTKTINLSTSFNMQANISGTYVSSIVASGDITLDTIPRASQPSCITYPNTTQDIGSLGSTITIYTNRKSSSFKHSVHYSLGSKTGRIGLLVDDSVRWTIPKNLAEEILNGTTGSGTITLTTYDSNYNEIGSKSVTFIVSIPNTNEFKPSISSVALEEVEELPSGINFYIQSLSRIKGTITAAGAYNSTIVSYSTTINNEFFNTAEWTTSLISLVNPTLSVTVKDSRGRTSTYSTTVTVLEYKVPTINTIAIYRDSLNPANIDLSFSCSIYKLNSQNTKQFIFYYKKTTDSQYTSVTISDNDITTTTTNKVNIYSANISIPNSDTSASYNAYLEAIDLFNTIPTETKFINTVFKLINISADKTAFAIGKLHELSGHIENALPQTNYENIYRKDSNYNGIVLSCPSIEDGKLIYNSSNTSLEFDINNVTYGITIWQSDERLKEKIKLVKSSFVDKIKAIKHINFTFKENGKFIPIGYSANQLKEVDESFIIETGEDKILQPNINILIPVITKTLQEIIERVEKLEKKGDTYESN